MKFGGFLLGKPMYFIEDQKGEGMYSKKVVVTGAAGFIGHHLCDYLLGRGYHVTGVDIKWPEFGTPEYNAFFKKDLRVWDSELRGIFSGADQVYALAADMGGMGFIGTGENDQNIIWNNAMINLNTARAVALADVPKVLFTSSACVYNQGLQAGGGDAPMLKEQDAIPANPDTVYGWEKLFSEFVYGSLVGVDARAARFHNVYGPEGTWEGGREKAPAAFCRKIAVAKLTGGTEIEMWGDGEQSRSFCYIVDALAGLYSMMNVDLEDGAPRIYNIGSDRAVTMNELAEIVMRAADYNVSIKHIDGPEGVRARNADLTLARQYLGYESYIELEAGIKRTYDWIEKQVK